jgi:uncharacterized protein
VSAGNASSLPPRLPDLSWVLRKLDGAPDPINVTTVCLSYRGYWKSHDRPSERGINLDTEAALQWTLRMHQHRADEGGLDQRPVVILWGQSVGCGFATNLAASTALPVDGLILETPFTSARAMLKALYPQRWLPYQYLWPFLRNHLDSLGNLATIAGQQEQTVPGIYMIEAAKDELVPSCHGVSLYEKCLAVGLPVQRWRVRGALHNDASVRPEGKAAIAQSILAIVKAASRRVNSAST